MRQVWVYKNIKEMFLFNGALFLLGDDKSLSGIKGADPYARVDLSNYGGKVNDRHGILQFYYGKTLFRILEEDLSIEELSGFDAEFAAKVGNKYYCEDRIDRKTHHYRIIEDNKTVFERTSENWLRIINGQFYWQERLKSYGIAKIDLVTGQDIWSYDIREIGKYYDTADEKWKEGSILANTIVSKNGNLIFFGSDSVEGSGNEARQYIALNEKTGIKQWDLRNIKYGSSVIEFYGDDIISMHDNRVLVIDSVTGKVKGLVDLSERLGKGIHVYNSFRVIKNKLYFCETRMEKAVGVINLDNFELESLFRVNTAAFQINTPLANDEYMFVKDSDSAIHVYELG